MVIQRALFTSQPGLHIKPRTGFTGKKLVVADHANARVVYLQRLDVLAKRVPLRRCKSVGADETGADAVTVVAAHVGTGFRQPPPRGHDAANSESGVSFQPFCPALAR